jgi:hypothetical protein
MPISTFPRHDYDEDEYLLKPAGLRDTHSEGKVKTEEFIAVNRRFLLDKWKTLSADESQKRSAEFDEVEKQIRLAEGNPDAVTPLLYKLWAMN